MRKSDPLGSEQIQYNEYQIWTDEEADLAMSLCDDSSDAYSLPLPPQKEDQPKPLPLSEEVIEPPSLISGFLVAPLDENPVGFKPTSPPSHMMTPVPIVGKTDHALYAKVVSERENHISEALSHLNLQFFKKLFVFGDPSRISLYETHLRVESSRDYSRLGKALADTSTLVCFPGTFTSKARSVVLKKATSSWPSGTPGTQVHSYVTRGLLIWSLTLSGFLSYKFTKTPGETEFVAGEGPTPDFNLERQYSIMQPGQELELASLKRPLRDYASPWPGENIYAVYSDILFPSVGVTPKFTTQLFTADVLSTETDLSYKDRPPSSDSVYFMPESSRLTYLRKGSSRTFAADARHTYHLLRAGKKGFFLSEPLIGNKMSATFTKIALLSHGPSGITSMYAHATTDKYLVQSTYFESQMYYRIICRHSQIARAHVDQATKQFYVWRDHQRLVLALDPPISSFFPMVPDFYQISRVSIRISKRHASCVVTFPPNHAEGFRLYKHGSLTSTNIQALFWARNQDHFSFPGLSRAGVYRMFSLLKGPLPLSPFPK